MQESVHRRSKFPERLSEFGLILFAVSIPVSHVPAEFAIGFAVLGWILDGVINKDWQVNWNPLFLPLMLYLGWNILCSAVSPRPAHSLWADVDNEWSLFIMLMMSWTVRESRTLRRILICWFTTSAVAMVYAIWQTLQGEEYYRKQLLDPMGHFFRSVGFYGFYLTFAAFAMTVFFVSLVFALERGPKDRWKRLIIPFLSIVAVIFTFARSVWLSVLAAVPFAGFVRGKKSDWIVAGGLMVIFVISLFAIPTLRGRAESIFDLKANQTRINLWETSMKINADFRFIGIGEDNFDYYFEKYKVPGYYDTTAHPHNDYLNVLVNAGIPGLIFFVWMWISVLRSGILTWRRAKDDIVRTAALGGVLSLFGLMVSALFQDYYGSFINCLGWWFVVGLVLAATNIDKSMKEAAERTA